MELDFITDGIYIPKWKDNKKKPENEQIKIFWHFPTNEERDVIHGVRSISITGKFSFKVDTNLLCRYFIDKIENLKISGDEIKIADDLLSCRHASGLYYELKTYFIEQLNLSDEDKKK